MSALISAGTRHTLLIGLPETGKTTFMAAFWHVLENEGVAESLKLDRVTGDRQYLNRIRSDWLACKPVARTQIGFEQVVTLRLTAREGSAATELVVPDFSGESFQYHLRERRWSQGFDEFVAKADGVLLFVHASKFVEPVAIDDWATVAAELGGGDEASSDLQVGVEWTPDLMPTQVQLVELLQLLLARSADFRPLRLAVVLSAWDLVSKLATSPEDWLQSKLPLLDQYLRANPEQFDVRVYGLSAQGGDLQGERVSLLHQAQPAERIVIVGVETPPHDITAPIRWLMDG